MKLDLGQTIQLTGSCKRAGVSDAYLHFQALFVLGTIRVIESCNGLSHPLHAVIWMHLREPYDT